MSTFKTHVRSRGKDRDYAWITSDTDAEKRHPSLVDLEGSCLYALSVEKQATQYHGIILIDLPDMKDVFGRTIRMEIVLEDLTETQARAIAVAYLQLPINNEGSRYWEAARKTYTPTPDGFCEVDTVGLQKAIEQLIHSNEPGLDSETPEYKLHLQETSGNMGEMTKKAVEHLKQYTLSNTDGIKIFLNDQIQKEEADLQLQSMMSLGKSTVEKKALSPDSPKSPAPVAVKSPARVFADQILGDVLRSKPIAPRYSRNQRFVIIGAAVIVLIAFTIALCTGGKKDDGSVVEAPAPQPTHPYSTNPTPDTPESKQGVPTTQTPQNQENSKVPNISEKPTKETPEAVIPDKTENQGSDKSTSSATELPDSPPQTGQSMP